MIPYIKDSQLLISAFCRGCVKLDLILFHYNAFCHHANYFKATFLVALWNLLSRQAVCEGSGAINAFFRQLGKHLPKKLLKLDID